ncbi:hypothetical protein PPERSA_01956 [Pseudocohnilembus persalinus]|uniref:Uncharacterized protein n=1 Tax=Pseudocohnilembus persalinus TaxID=266149 RepID=A0A0V0R3K9_PSEPJ|nr:hypothetical protein PPERSA_01956 [Pseudocohnilembus persalinus]|eukprot:KRX09069.1 hypothetical protein PPERSA_01956 [Pseudocohnilembus persalinus]
MSLNQFSDELDRNLTIFYHPIFQDLMKLWYHPFNKFDLKLQKCLIPNFELNNAFQSALNDWLKEIQECKGYFQIDENQNLEQAISQFMEELEENNNSMFTIKEWVQLIKTQSDHAAFGLTQFKVNIEIFSKFLFDLALTWCEYLDIELFTNFLFSLFISLTQGQDLKNSTFKQLQDIQSLPKQFILFFEVKKKKFKEKKNQGLLKSFKDWCDWNYLRISQFGEEIIINFQDFFLKDDPSVHLQKLQHKINNQNQSPQQLQQNYLMEKINLNQRIIQLIDIFDIAINQINEQIFQQNQTQLSQRSGSKSIYKNKSLSKSKEQEKQFYFDKIQNYQNTGSSIIKDVEQYIQIQDFNQENKINDIQQLGNYLQQVEIQNQNINKQDQKDITVQGQQLKTQNSQYIGDNEQKYQNMANQRQQYNEDDIDFTFLNQQEFKWPKTDYIIKFDDETGKLIVKKDPKLLIKGRQLGNDEVMFHQYAYNQMKEFDLFNQDIHLGPKEQFKNVLLPKSKEKQYLYQNQNKNHNESNFEKQRIQLSRQRLLTQQYYKRHILKEQTSQIKNQKLKKLENNKTTLTGISSFKRKIPNLQDNQLLQETIRSHRMQMEQQEQILNSGKLQINLDDNQDHKNNSQINITQKQQDQNNLNNLNKQVNENKKEFNISQQSKFIELPQQKQQLYTATNSENKQSRQSYLDYLNLELGDNYTQQMKKIKEQQEEPQITDRQKNKFQKSQPLVTYKFLKNGKQK